METGCAPIAVCWGAVSRVPEHQREKSKADEANPGPWDEEDEAMVFHTAAPRLGHHRPAS